ncbi:MAG: hypothetical protein COT32_00140 [Candidatus Nealsonbacteria bacterium CG08_land_8_20_14_0_20_36_22]|uniref:Cohesin domain-containing protein n=1 Tax=Candidatus Nealsonbacteria bacterium CG08_land_8_20_14_0_20_36_22 TaxID=1974704 RepID=A0A2H0YQ13_9BACT|nr:MAG: hypothetical protein COT32_00140 [Candidatus Nealsonbacteria bacterium CG08_land_8_20_14_0_20_36_22]
MKTIKLSIIALIIGVSITLSFGVQAQSLEGIELPALPTISKPISQMTVPELQAKIQEIIAVVQKLQTILVQLRGKPDISRIPSTYTFTTNLKYGTSSQDVKYLQIFLNSDPDTQISISGKGSPNNEIIYFGLKTQQSVIKFQEEYKQDILTPLNLSQGTGFVGSGTRNKINQLLEQYRAGVIPTQTPSPTPIITPTPTPTPTPLTPQPEITLYVDLKVSVDSSNWQNTLTGTAPLTGVDLKATVTGTATGTINYMFDCTNDGTWDSPDDSQYKGITTIIKEFTNGCSFQNPGTYTAKVKVERNVVTPVQDTATITVNQPTSTYTLSINQTGSGSVTKNPNQSSYASGTTVTLTATAAAGYTFSSWSGDLTGTTNPATITMNSNKTITANFAQLSGTIVTVSSASGAAGATNIAVPITVSGLGAQKVYAIDITLTYDQSLITATGVQKGSITSSWNLESNVSTAGQARIALYSSTELASSGGEIAKLIFSVKSGASSGSKSALTLTKANLNEVTANNKLNGEFTIQ